MKTLRPALHYIQQILNIRKKGPSQIIKIIAFIIDRDEWIKKLDAGWCDRIPHPSQRCDLTDLNQSKNKSIVGKRSYRGILKFEIVCAINPFDYLVYHVYNACQL
jgi:hypothetical protein